MEAISSTNNLMRGYGMAKLSKDSDKINNITLFFEVNFKPYDLLKEIHLII